MKIKVATTTTRTEVNANTVAEAVEAAGINTIGCTLHINGRPVSDMSVEVQDGDVLVAVPAQKAGAIDVFKAPELDDGEEVIRRVEPGVLFEFNDTLYVRVKYTDELDAIAEFEGSQYPALNIETGELISIDGSLKVKTYPDAEITVA